MASLTIKSQPPVVVWQRRHETREHRRRRHKPKVRTRQTGHAICQTKGDHVLRHLHRQHRDQAHTARGPNGQHPGQSVPSISQQGRFERDGRPDPCRHYRRIGQRASSMMEYGDYWRGPSKSPCPWLGGKPSDNISLTSPRCCSRPSSAGCSPSHAAMCDSTSRTTGSRSEALVASGGECCDCLIRDVWVGIELREG